MQSILDDDRGAIAVITAIVLIVLLGAVGLAVDAGSGYAAKARLQAVLDSAVLAAVRSPTQQDAEKTFSKLMAAMGAEGKGAMTWSSSGGKFTVDGSAELSLDTKFMGVFGLSNMTIQTGATATSPAKPSKLKISIGSTKGWNAKRIDFWVERLDGKKEIVGSIIYTPTKFEGEGTGTSVVTPSSTIEVGTFRNLWVELTSTDYATKKEKTFATNKPNMDHFFIDGRQLKNTEPASLEKLFPCGTTARYALEDTHFEEQQMEWATQDQFFDVTTTCDQPDAVLAVLVK